MRTTKKDLSLLTFNLNFKKVRDSRKATPDLMVLVNNVLINLLLMELIVLMLKKQVFILLKIK